MGPIAIGLILLVVLVLAHRRHRRLRIKVAGPNEAFIVTGRKGKPVTNPETGAISTDLSGQKVVMGASVFVLPVIQKLASIDLSARQISVSVGSAVSAQGIKCSLEGVAIVKVGGAEDSIRAAAQRFLGQQDHIEHFTQEVLAGSLRSIVGRLSVEEIVKDRAAFAREVAEEAETSLTNQGLVLDTFQLQDIQTEGNYLKDLGRPEAARAEKEAAIAESIARREAEQARHQGRGGDRRRRPRAGPAQGRDPRRDRRRHGPGRGGRPDRQGGQGPGGHRRPGAGGRAPGAAARARSSTPRSASRPTPSATPWRRRPRRAKARALREAEAEQARREAAAQALRAEGEAEAAAILARGDGRGRGDGEEGRRLRPVRRRRRARPAGRRCCQARQARRRRRWARSTRSRSSPPTAPPTSRRRVASNVTQGMQLASDLLGIDLGRCSSAWPTATARP